MSLRNAFYLPNSSRSKTLVVPASGTELPISDVFGPNFYVAQALAPFEVAFDQPDQWFYAEQGFSFENIGFGDRTFQRIWVRSVNLPGSELQTVRIVYGGFKQNLVTLKNIPPATVTRISTGHFTIPDVSGAPGLILGVDPGRLSAEIGWERGPDDGLNNDYLWAWGFGVDEDTAKNACYEAANECVAFVSQTAGSALDYGSFAPNQSLSFYYDSFGSNKLFKRRNCKIEGPSAIYGSAIDSLAAALFENTPYRLRIKTTHLL